jgi:thiol-disulfide isomerase/thioredoxin
LLSGCLDSSDGNGGEDFIFTMLDGAKKSLSDYRGKVVILDMWATWCGPCKFQMVELKKIYENYSRDVLEILSIDVDQYETSYDIQEFKDEFMLDYDIELNWVFGMDDGSVWEKYKFEDEGIPVVSIFDQRGNIYFSNEGVAVFSEIPVWWPEDVPEPPKLAPYLEELLE